MLIEAIQGVILETQLRDMRNCGRILRECNDS